MLEEKTGYALLVPPAKTDDEKGYQTAEIPLLRSQTSAVMQPARACSISGEVFSLEAKDTKEFRTWVIRSPSAQGWIAADTRYDIHAEWTSFLQKLLELDQQSCFPSHLPLFTVRRLVAESMPLPAPEAAYFVYSFGNTSYVDLLPGMELKLERTLKDPELRPKSRH